jgi:hypothetical protein
MAIQNCGTKSYTVGQEFGIAGSFNNWWPIDFSV